MEVVQSISAMHLIDGIGGDYVQFSLRWSALHSDGERAMSKRSVWIARGPVRGEKEKKRLTPERHLKSTPVQKRRLKSTPFQRRRLKSTLDPKRGPEKYTGSKKALQKYTPVQERRLKSTPVKKKAPQKYTGSKGKRETAVQVHWKGTASNSVKCSPSE